MIKDKIRDKLRQLIIYFRNIWLFRKELAKFQDWDYGYSLNLFAKSIELQADRNERGYEYYKDRIVKVSNMRRAAEIMRNLSDGDYIKMAEEKLGYEFSTSFNNFEFKELPPTESGEVLYELIDNRPQECRDYDNIIFDLSEELRINDLEELTELIKGDSVVSYRIRKITGSHPQFKRGNGGILSWWD